MRSLVDYQSANKALEKARAKNKEVQQAEMKQQESCDKFEKISEVHKCPDFLLSFPLSS